MDADGPAVFYFGIIDVLQEWNMKKRMERATKINALGKDRDGLSACNAQKFQTRFMKRAVYENFPVHEIKHDADGFIHI
jgi:1-phosphatidylinositol-4-phosphate 5-kinase